MISLYFDGVHRKSPLPQLIYIPPCSRMKVPLESQCLVMQPVSLSSVRLAAPDSPRLPLFKPSKVRLWSSWSCFYIPLSSLPRGPPKVSSIIICIAPPHLCEADCSFWILVSSGISYLYIIYYCVYMYRDGGFRSEEFLPLLRLSKWMVTHPFLQLVVFVSLSDLTGLNTRSTTSLLNQGRGLKICVLKF